MPPKNVVGGPGIFEQARKRKDPPSSFANGNKSHSRGRDPKRVKLQDARSILAQTSDSALSNGELDLQKFLAAREYEIKALQDGMQRSKGALTTRAFQQVPRDMRRRTASHNVKRVPRRLQERGKREMREDNTPTVTPNKRKPSNSRGRVRAETAKKLGLLADKKKRAKAAARTVASKEEKAKLTNLAGRTPRPKVDKLSEPPKPASKFRKRQIHKTWLPTHMYHAKRAKMTDPKKPLWRFAIPLTNTEKSYRPTHRASGKRGAVCWDMSYMATIGLEGSELALEKVLRGLGITQDDMWGTRGQKWREGKRTWNGWLSRDFNSTRLQIGPATVIWCASETSSPDDSARTHEGSKKKNKEQWLKRIIVRMHPSVFLETWNETLRISKMQRPVVHVEDLRFEVGSIEVTGPSATEALLGILHPDDEPGDTGTDAHSNMFKTLGGVTNPASLPSNALLTFTVIDPRLRYPPRQVDLPKSNDDGAALSLLELLAAWPADQGTISKSFFDRAVRHKAGHLPAQKALNRRKGLSATGAFPARLPTDPPIPILLSTSRTSSSAAAQGTWILLAPWKCILPIWYGLMHYPLSSGGNPRFGGLQETQQVHFEHRKPWFPADYPGTQAGWAWEMEEREKRKMEWERRPKGKRVEFSSLNLGLGRKGEIGLGWACDYEKLFDEDPLRDQKGGGQNHAEELLLPRQNSTPLKQAKQGSISPPFQHLSSSDFQLLLSSRGPQFSSRTLATVRITLFSRGVPLSCARIYRLPSPQQLSKSPPSATGTDVFSTPTLSLREQWLALEPLCDNSKPKAKRKTPRRPTHKGSYATPMGRRALAQELLQTPPLTYPAQDSEETHPPVPGEDDLIGFVTTGNFNLAEGKGTAIGSVVVAKITQHPAGSQSKGWLKERQLCIVRNAGETIGRLGIWEVA